MSGHEYVTSIVNGVEATDDFDAQALTDDAVIRIENGIVFGPMWECSEPLFETYFKRWRKQQRTTYWSSNGTWTNSMPSRQRAAKWCEMDISASDLIREAALSALLTHRPELNRIGLRQHQGQLCWQQRSNWHPVCT